MYICEEKQKTKSFPSLPFPLMFPTPFRTQIYQENLAPFDTVCDDEETPNVHENGEEKEKAM